MPAKTNNTDLRFALTTQPGEGAPRFEVSRDGRAIPYEELQRLPTSELPFYTMTSFTFPVLVRKRDRFGDEYSIFGGPGDAETIIHGRDPASKSLESFYQLGIAVLTGGRL